jgi:hypothetical protein
MPRQSKKKMAQLFRPDAALLRSGDPLVDWFFRQFLSVLRSERVRIVRKKRLINPDDPQRRVIRGLMDPDIHPSGNLVQILINSAKTTHRDRDEEAETLVHELAHVILPKTSERQILAIEDLLARRLTLHQRRCLKTFIPRHEVKYYPQALDDESVATA